MRLPPPSPLALLVLLTTVIGPTSVMAAADDDNDTDDRPDELESGDEYRVVGALAELPASVLEQTDWLVLTGDVVSAIADSGLDVDRTDADQLTAALSALSGGPSESGTSASMFLPLPSWTIGATTGRADMSQLVGWTMSDVDAFVSFDTPPGTFHVVAGNLDDDIFPATLVEVADDVVSLGESEDLRANPGERTPLSMIGVAQRLAADDGRIAFGPVLDQIAAWVDDDRARPSMIDDPAVTAIADALDAADVSSAVLTGSSPREAVDGQPAIESLGIGWGVDADRAAVITIVFRPPAATDPASAVKPLQLALEDGVTTTGEPISDLITLDTIEVGDGVVVATVRPAEGRGPSVVYQMLVRREIPLITTSS